MARLSCWIRNVPLLLVLLLGALTACGPAWRAAAGAAVAADAPHLSKH